MWFSGGELPSMQLKLNPQNYRHKAYTSHYSTTPNSENCANLNDYQEMKIQNVPQYSGRYCQMLLRIKTLKIF